MLVTRASDLTSTRVQCLSQLLHKYHQHSLEDEHRRPSPVPSLWLIRVDVFKWNIHRPLPSWFAVLLIVTELSNVILDFWSLPSPCSDPSVSYEATRLLRALCSLALKIWQDRDCKTSLDKLFWAFTPSGAFRCLWWKKFHMSCQILSHFSLCPLFLSATIHHCEEPGLVLSSCYLFVRPPQNCLLCRLNRTQLP